MDGGTMMILLQLAGAWALSMRLMDLFEAIDTPPKAKKRRGAEGNSTAADSER